MHLNWERPYVHMYFGSKESSLIICITDLIRIYLAKCLKVDDGGDYSGHFPFSSQWIAICLCLEMVAHSLSSSEQV